MYLLIFQVERIYTTFLFRFKSIQLLWFTGFDRIRVREKNERAREREWWTKLETLIKMSDFNNEANLHWPFYGASMITSKRTELKSNFVISAEGKVIHRFHFLFSSRHPISRAILFSFCLIVTNYRCWVLFSVCTLIGSDSGKMSERARSVSG